MFKSLLGTTNDSTLTLMRVVLGMVFFIHGAQKMLGWFGGYGFTGTMKYFTSVLHPLLPWPFWPSSQNSSEVWL